MKTGACQYGPQCKFAHVRVEDVIHTGVTFPNIVCIYFLKNVCARPSNCPWTHVNLIPAYFSSLQTQQQQPAPPPPPPAYDPRFFPDSNFHPMDQHSMYLDHSAVGGVPRPMTHRLPHVDRRGLSRSQQVQMQQMANFTRLQNLIAQQQRATPIHHDADQQQTFAMPRSTAPAPAAPIRRGFAAQQQPIGQQPFYEDPMAIGDQMRQFRSAPIGDGPPPPPPAAYMSGYPMQAQDPSQQYFARQQGFLAAYGFPPRDPMAPSPQLDAIYWQYEMPPARQYPMQGSSRPGVVAPMRMTSASAAFQKTPGAPPRSVAPSVQDLAPWFSALSVEDQHQHQQQQIAPSPSSFYNAQIPEDHLPPTQTATNFLSPALAHLNMIPNVDARQHQQSIGTSGSPPGRSLPILTPPQPSFFDHHYLLNGETGSNPPSSDSLVGSGSGSGGDSNEDSGSNNSSPLDEWRDSPPSDKSGGSGSSSPQDTNSSSGGSVMSEIEKSKRGESTGSGCKLRPTSSNLSQFSNEDSSESTASSGWSGGAQSASSQSAKSQESKRAAGDGTKKAANSSRTNKPSESGNSHHQQHQQRESPVTPTLLETEKIAVSAISEFIVDRDPLDMERVIAPNAGIELDPSATFSPFLNHSSAQFPRIVPLINPWDPTTASLLAHHTPPLFDRAVSPPAASKLHHPFF